MRFLLFAALLLAAPLTSALPLPGPLPAGPALVGLRSAMPGEGVPAPGLGIDLLGPNQSPVFSWFVRRDPSTGGEATTPTAVPLSRFGASHGQEGTHETALDPGGGRLFIGRSACPGLGALQVASCVYTLHAGSGAVLHVAPLRVELGAVPLLDHFVEQPEYDPGCDCLWVFGQDAGNANWFGTFDPRTGLVARVEDLGNSGLGGATTFDPATRRHFAFRSASPAVLEVRDVASGALSRVPVAGLSPRGAEFEPGCGCLLAVSYVSASGNGVFRIDPGTGAWNHIAWLPAGPPPDYSGRMFSSTLDPGRQEYHFLAPCPGPDAFVTCHTTVALDTGAVSVRQDPGLRLLEYAP